MHRRSTPLTEYARDIRMARRRRGFTQSQLAYHLGVTGSFVSKLENGSVYPSPRILNRCSEVLGVESVPALTYANATHDLPVANMFRESSKQLSFDGIQADDWVARLLPDESFLSAGPPPVFHWDIPQTIGQLAYLTHNFYRYYGKFPATIPRRLLREFPPKRGTWILDNYCGCGTTLVEAKCEGLSSIGIDISPLATLASRVKTSHVNAAHVLKDLDVVRRRLAKVSKRHSPDKIPHLTKWFDPENISALRNLKDSLLGLKVTAAREFLVLAFFAIIRRASRAYDGEVRPHINPQKKRRDPIAAFTKKVLEMTERMTTFERCSANEARVVAITADNRNLKSLVPWNQYPVGLVISHPPYLNCFDYVPVFKLEYLWADGFDEVGALDYSSLRRTETRCWPATDKTIFNTYFDDLRQAYSEIANVVDPGTRCCVVLGDCTVQREVVPVLDRFTDIMDDIGFDIERVMLRSTHYGTGKYAYADRADYHGRRAEKRDGILMFRRR